MYQGLHRLHCEHIGTLEPPPPFPKDFEAVAPLKILYLGVPEGPYRDTRRRRALCLSPHGRYPEAFAYHLRRRRRRALWLWGGWWLAAGEKYTVDSTQEHLFFEKCQHYEKYTFDSTQERDFFETCQNSEKYTFDSTQEHLIFEKISKS